MIHTFQAIFEDGVLKPLEPLNLAEHQYVRVSVSAEDVAPEQKKTDESGAGNGKSPDNGAANESFFDAASRLGFIGCIEGTPPDLSTNKKYMEGFGKRGS